MESLAVTRAVDASFWRGRRVLLTGHTGFKGSWLTLWLGRLGAAVTGVSLPPATTPNLFSEADVSSLCESRFCDIRDADALAALIRAARPEIVLHLLALIGGTIGALLGQMVFRHKTRKMSFRVIFIATVVLQIAMICGWWYWKQNATGRVTTPGRM